MQRIAITFAAIIGIIVVAGAVWPADGELSLTVWPNF